MSKIEPRWWTPEQLAETTGLSIEQAAKLRSRGEGPPYVKFGRSIRYLNLDVLTWHSQNRVTARSGAES